MKPLREFTATVYVFNQNKVLLHKHKKLGKWLPPGGHIEPNETPPEAARREVLEETGLEITFIEQENLRVSAYNAQSFQRPFLCLLEKIPKSKDQIEHEHMDLIFLARADQIKEDLMGFQWFLYEELENLDIFPDTAEVLSLLLKEDLLTEIESTQSNTL